MKQEPQTGTEFKSGKEIAGVRLRCFFKGNEDERHSPLSQSTLSQIDFNR